MPTGSGPGWGAALGWNIIPAGIGNMAGGAFLVALPFWYALDPARRKTLVATSSDRRSSHEEEQPQQPAA
jgi:hypothetical protein